MTSTGAPNHPIFDASGINITVVASSWHEKIMASLIAGALEYLKTCGAKSKLIKVPGSFEIPLGVKYAIEDGSDGVVALGVVIRGNTPHFEFVCAGVTTGIMDLMLHTGIPVGFGVLTCDNEEQALARSGFVIAQENKGIEAAAATLAMILQKSRGIS